MGRKNLNNNPLRIVRDSEHATREAVSYPIVLSNLAVAQAMLAKHKESAMPHFIAIVKELESIYGIRFEQIPDE